MLVLLLQLMNAIPDPLTIIFFAMLPVTELRAAIPLALFVFNMSIREAVFYSLLGNTIPLVIIFLLFRPMLNWASERFPRIHDLIYNHLRALDKKHAKAYQRYGTLFLFLFVMIPLPGSGVWTGSVLAILFGMRPSYSIPAIILGMGVSAGIILMISLGVISL